MMDGLSIAGSVLLLVSSLIEVALVVALFLVFRRYQRVRARERALLQEKEVVFNFVHDVGEVFADSDTVDVDTLLANVLHYAMRTTRAGGGVVYLLDPDGQTLRAHALSGIFPPLQAGVDAGMERAVSKSQHLERIIRSQPLRRGEGLVGEVVDFAAPILIEDAERDPRVPHYDVDFLKIHSILLVPMRFRHEVRGVLAVVNRIDGAPFSPGDLDLLQALADHASVSVHYAILREDLEAKKRLDRSLSLAREIQGLLLPQTVPAVPGIELAAFSVPAMQIGGDYYDFFRVDDTHLGIAIADVSGKGVGGAILMSICRTVLRTAAPGELSPSVVLKCLGRELARDLSEDMFVTALYLVLELPTRRLTFARAGHDHPLLYTRADGSIREPEAPGVALGMGDAEVLGEVLRDETLVLAAGDALVLYTDGVTEAMDTEGQEWGLPRLIETVQGCVDEGAERILGTVRQRLIRFVGGNPPYDDMTMVALRMLP